MKLLKSIVVTILLGAVITNSLAAESVTKASGGSIKTRGGSGNELNQDSSLTREWITIHDKAIPADIYRTVGVEIKYGFGDHRYWAVGSITAKKALSAIKIRFLTFDIWGDHTGNLSGTEIVDMEAGESIQFDWEWDVYSENEASEYFASIAYIAQVRTKNGRVIKADLKAVLKQARKFSKKFSEGDLEPKPEKK